MRNKQSGFTLIELIIVIGISLLLFGFMTINLVGNQKIVSVNSVRDGLVSDLTSQQTKAMGGAGGAAGTSFGIYFLSDKYILFQGASYSPEDTSNFSVNLDSGNIFTSISFPASSIIFASGSGQIIGFQNGQNTIEIGDSQGTRRTVTINRYGVVIGD